MSVTLPRDIVIDDNAIKQAAKDFGDLSGSMHDLKNQIQKELDNLKAGFDTPAGKKFFSTYEESLIKPINEQIQVLEHLQLTLNQVGNSYQPIDTAYRVLNASIENVQP